jgi:hypothetical protein
MGWVYFLDRMFFLDCIYLPPSRRQEATVFQRALLLFHCVLLLLPAPQPMLLQRMWARTGE